MSFERFLSRARNADRETSLDSRIIAELHTLSVHRGIIGSGLADFNRGANQGKKRFESPVKTMLEFGQCFLREGFEAALEKVGTEKAVSVQITIPNTQYETSASERYIPGKLLGLVDFCRDWDAPSFEGIAMVGNRRYRDFVAVRVSETGATWLNAIHLTQPNRIRTGREVLEDLFPNAQKRRRRRKLP